MKSNNSGAGRCRPAGARTGLGTSALKGREHVSIETRRAAHTELLSRYAAIAGYDPAEIAAIQAAIPDVAYAGYRSWAEHCYRRMVATKAGEFSDAPECFVIRHGWSAMRGSNT